MMSPTVRAVRKRGGYRMHSMFNLLLQSSFFIAAFVAGYVVCAWRSHRRESQFTGLSPRISTFGHPRRAF
jgi:hypothetical protein